MNLQRFMNRDALLIICISIFNSIMYAVHLGTFRWFHYDEVAYVIAARDLLSGQFSNSEHPPFGKLIIALGIKLFGDNPDGWRIFSVVAGVIGVVMVYLLAKRMFGGIMIPTLASLFVSVETYWFASARLAMLDMFLATLIIISLYYIWRYHASGKLAWMYAAAICIGSAAAVKWTGASLLVLLWWVICLRHRHRAQIAVIATFVGLAVYGVWYIPLYIYVPGLPNILALHREMLDFHMSFRTGADWFNGGIIQWFQSFPIPGGAAYDDPSTWQRVYQVVYAGNIFILWTGLAVIIATGMRQIKAREPRLMFIIGSALVMAVPWIIIPGTWNVFLPLVPIMALLLAYWCRQFWSMPGWFGKIGVTVFVLLCISWYAALLPRLWPLLYEHGFIDTLII